MMIVSTRLLEILLISLGFNCVLLFCLLSPTIVRLIHRRTLTWKEKDLDVSGMT